MNTEKFTGKAEHYAAARPSYPQAAVDYICSLMPPDAVIADVGAGTGKFAVLLAERGYRIFAIEPNADMRSQLVNALSPYSNAQVIDSAAEATTLASKSVDVITCAQALHWFDPDAFRAECYRIARREPLVIAVYNNTPNGSSIVHSKVATETFFTAPTVREFPNPIYYTRESWLAYVTSRSYDPLPMDERYAAHIAEMDAVFDKEKVDGLLLREVVTKVYSEVLA